MAKFVKGQVPWNKGIACADETKAKLSAKNKGRKHTPETEAKVTQNLLAHGKATRFVKGQVPHNKGTTCPRYTKEEIKEHQKEWRQENKNKINAVSQKWRKENPEAVKAMRKRAREKNAGRVNSANAKRHAEKLKRTPSWLTKDDLWLIKEAYDLAVKRTKLFGFAWHVDHIVPLQGKIVSGLHVISNLQVIEGKLNIMKNNKFEGELFCQA
jgi:hypothetical protein